MCIEETHEKGLHPLKGIKEAGDTCGCFPDFSVALQTGWTLTQHKDK